MKVNIKHVNKTTGLISKKNLHGVALAVLFSEEEKAIIEQRKLADTIIMERGAPADVDAKKHANRGLMAKVVTSVLSGPDANNFHLTISKLLYGIDTYFFDTSDEAKQYEQDLKEELPKLKNFIVDNETSGDGDSFEL